MKLLKLQNFGKFSKYISLRYSAYKAKSFEDMLLSIRDYTIITVVQASHHQGDVRYGASMVIQWLCMSLISVGWALLKSPDLWNNFNLDSILEKYWQI